MKMSKVKYAIAIAYASTKSFVELVTEHLTDANWAHNSRRSKVVSVRAEFARFLANVYREQEVYADFASMFSAIVLGKYHVDSALYNRLMVRIATVVGYPDLPSEKEREEIFLMLCEDYGNSNPYVTEAMLAEGVEINEEIPEKSVVAAGA